MEKQRKIYQSILGIVLVTLLLLLIPLVAMQFTDEVVWTASDFIIAGVILFSTGVAYVMITRARGHIVFRAATGFALGITLFMVWANLAVGLIGAGPHAGNLMYIGVLAVTIIGVILSRLSPTGMEHAMYATAFALVLVAVIALIANMQEYPGSSVMEIVLVNGFFIVLFLIAGLLFRYAAHKQLPDRSTSGS